MTSQSRKLLPLLPLSTRPMRSPPLQPSLNLFTNRDLLYEYIKKLDYPSIKNTCLMYKDVYLTCSTDVQIGELIRKRRIEFKTYLLLRNVNIQYKIVDASTKGDVEVVDELIKRCYDPSENGNSAIIYASGRGHIQVVNRLLQDERVDPSSHNNLASALASKNEHLSVVRRLLQDIRVRKSLSPDRFQKYLKQVGYIFPPPSTQLLQ